VTSLHRRVVALERRTIQRGPWSDEVEEKLRSLRREERNREEIRQAARAIIALMWNEAGNPERAEAVMQGHQRLDEEWRAAMAALDEDALRRLGAACHPVTARAATRSS
jgi:hypothetical protein